MANKKKSSGTGKAAPQKESTSAGKSGSKTPWIAAGVGVLVVIAVIAALGMNGKGGGNGAPPEEQKYMDRYLPKGYEEPKVADVMLYDSSTAMSDAAVQDTGAQLTLSVDQLAKNKVSKFEYAKPGGKPIPMLAYVKPSGKLFVGVNYCPPCQGIGQHVETDGTLTCDTCGTKRNVETGVGISGGCKLYPLDEMPAKLAGGKVTIDKSAIDGWTQQPLDRASGGNV